MGCENKIGAKNLDILSLKPSASQRDSSFKFQLNGRSSFGGVNEQTSRFNDILLILMEDIFQN